MDKGLKEKILKLFHLGKNYPQIMKKLNCSKGTISYHCSKFRYKDERYSKPNLKKYQRYYDTYGSVYKTADYFSVNAGTLKNLLKLKQKKFTFEEMEYRKIKYVSDWRRRTKIRAVEYKGGKCQKCGYNKSVCGLDFHHINPDEKEFTISGSKVNNWEKIKKELDKCVLICKNCHSEVHEEIDLKGYSDIIEKIITKIKKKIK